jgi:hypothetical protein
MGPSDVREQDFPLARITPDQEKAIVAKNLLLWDGDQQFWSKKLTDGKDNFGSLTGETIFSDGEKAEYKAQDKLILAIPELVPKINSLEGMQIAGRREGIIVPIGGEDAPDTEIIGHLVKSIQRKNNLDIEMTAAFTDGIVSGYPSWVFFDKTTGTEMNKELDVYHEIWDAVLPDPKFSRRDYSDAERLTRIRLMSKDQMIQTYPKRRKIIESDLRIAAYARNPFLDIAGFTANERDTLFNAISSSTDLYSRTGMTYVIERQFFVYIQTKVFASPHTDKVEELPSSWSQQDINRWMEFHPDYHPIEREMKILWVTTTTASGVLLENDRHWFQDGEFAAECYIPRMWNNKIYGVVEFLKGSLKGRNVTKIEHLHSLRMSNDDLMVVKEGALVNAKDAATEKARTGGIIVRSKFSSPEDIQFPMNGREQLGWSDMAETFLADIDRLSVDRNFEGGVQSSQESGKVVDRRITQMQVKYSPYLSTFNLTNLRVTRKILLMIPYTYTEQEIFRFVDPKSNQPRTVTLNEQTDYSWIGEGVARVKNNLSGARYDYIEAEGDNSVTAKEHELVVFNDIMQQLGRIQQVQLWPFLLTSVPNRMAQDFGRKLQEYFDAQANAPTKPEPMKLAFSLDGKDLLHNPRAIQILTNAGILQNAPAPGAANPQGGSSAMPQQQAQSQPSPQMAMSQE